MICVLSIFINAVCKCGIVVQRAAHAWKDDPAQVGRHTGGLEHLYGFFPGSVAVRLCIRSSLDPYAHKAAATNSFRTDLIAVARLAHSNERQGYHVDTQ